MILIDISLLIDYFRSKNKSKTWLASLVRREEVLAVSMFTHFEIHKGMRSTQEAFWDELFQQFEMLPFDEKCSMVAAELWRDLRSKKTTLDFLDLGIAATAVTYQAELATLNIRHFTNIKHLVLHEGR